jgi:hypothetical protein
MAACAEFVILRGSQELAPQDDGKKNPAGSRRGVLFDEL